LVARCWGLKRNKLSTQLGTEVQQP
jgi:hypothetical protein